MSTTNSPKLVDVSIVTRTKDRLPFLQRAVQSIAGQTTLPKEWIIVNDGGVEIQREQLISCNAAIANVDVKIINSKHIGRSRAANMGVEHASGKYILIHDDDDSLENSFLAETVTFMENNPHYVGVTAHAMFVVEKIDEHTEKITTVKTVPENFHVAKILISKMLQENLYPPISFLCRRDVFISAGGYNEDFDVLEDYCFSIQVLVHHGDIGLIPKHLSNHHIRYENHKNGNFNNTITVGSRTHCDFETIIKNGMLREDIKKGELGLGLLWAFADMTQEDHFVRDVFVKISKKIKKYRLTRFLKRKLIE